jgi:hypothetical protein
MMPNQIEGVLADGRNLYFRARHGGWALYVWEGDPDHIPFGVAASLVAYGDRDDAGWWDVSEALDFVNALLDEHGIR